MHHPKVGLKWAIFANLKIDLNLHGAGRALRGNLI
jgi:hypothetical protein